ncbi:TPA: TraK family protein [Legionella pneumophila]|uniref:Conjugal transfer protein TraK n=1 Tax=Legionella pneumophila TaxID=446 RepID=A0AAN5PZV6_LEGPN|nr:TraK family protein [Legionella pneumophila]TIH05332.1 conjugal transfer protein TraK [Legionella pneumophila]VEB31306.1 putative TraK protein [Legionella pneumophila]BCZ98087.1 hypothetical protein LEG80045_23430 [Legionella pneumophila]HAT1942731.1 TraK family protein [Legionella pneumophila]HAT3856435.1 TraK family protein [Legionella pneumophila]
MKKSLTEKIMTSKQSQLTTNPRKHKVEFLVMREDISEALEKGWSMMIIWETLRDEGSFTATYNTFRLYVLKYSNGQKLGYSPKDSVGAGANRSLENQSSKKRDITMPSFTSNPIPNMKDLL